MLIVGTTSTVMILILWHESLRGEVSEGDVDFGDSVAWKDIHTSFSALISMVFETMHGFCTGC